jgi:hypothetical protein
MRYELTGQELLQSRPMPVGCFASPASKIRVHRLRQINPTRLGKKAGHWRF